MVVHRGATLGILENLSQSNKCANCVEEEDRLRFIDDLSILEVVDLLTVGITSYNIKVHVPNDLPVHGNFVGPENLQTQNYVNQINQWTIKQRMLINAGK